MATFDGGKITREEVLAAGPVEKPLGQGDSGPEATDWRRDTIESLVARKVLAAECPEIPNFEIQVDQRAAVLLVEAMEDQLGWNALEVTEDEIRHQFDTHPEQYYDPEKIRLQHVYLEADREKLADQERQAVLRRMESIRQELLDGADFTAVVRRYSESSTAGRGGWLGIKRGDPVDRAFTEEAWSLELNEISEIVDTPHGFHVMVLREVHPPLQRAYEDVREFARKRALTEKREKAQEAFVEKYGPEYGLVKHYERLENPLAEDAEELISIGDFRFTIADLGREMPEKFLEQFFNGYMVNVVKYLDRVVLNRLLVLEAQKREIDQSPAFERAVENIREDLRYKGGLDQRIQAKVDAVPTETIHEYFVQNQKRYQTLRSTDMSLILLPPGDNLWETLQFGRALVDRIRSGESFEELARKYSRHFSARDGGILRDYSDFMIEARVQSGAKFRRAFDALEDGEVADAMVAECYDADTLRFVQTGVVVFRRDHVDEPVPQPFEIVEPLVRENYKRRYHQRFVEEVRAEVVAESGLVIFEERLPGV